MVESRDGKIDIDMNLIREINKKWGTSFPCRSNGSVYKQIKDFGLPSLVKLLKMKK